MIAVVDYHKGNLKSVERGLVAAGAEVLVTSDPAAIAKADAIVLPGVGAFADAAATMRELGQMDAIRERIAAGVPFLGICLGMHLLFEEGVEGAPREDDETSTHNARGLAVLPGVVTKMPKQDEHSLSYKVPHVGWNTVHFGDGSEGFGGAHQASSARAGQSSGPSVRARTAERLGAVEAPASAGQRAVAHEDVQVLALHHLVGLLRHLLAGQVDQQVGDAEHRIVRVVAHLGVHHGAVFLRDHAVQRQRQRDPLVVLDAAVIMRIEQREPVRLVQRVLLEVEAR